jgi:hypothetical protein
MKRPGSIVPCRSVSPASPTLQIDGCTLTWNGEQAILVGRFATDTERLRAIRVWMEDVNARQHARRRTAEARMMHDHYDARYH